MRLRGDQVQRCRGAEECVTPHLAGLPLCCGFVLRSESNRLTIFIAASPPRHPTHPNSTCTLLAHRQAVVEPMHGRNAVCTGCIHAITASHSAVFNNQLQSDRYVVLLLESHVHLGRPVR